MLMLLYWPFKVQFVHKHLKCASANSITTITFETRAVLLFQNVKLHQAPAIIKRTFYSSVCFDLKIIQVYIRVSCFAYEPN